MIVWFDNLGRIKEVINDESLRQGNFNANSIYFYLDGIGKLSLYEVVWNDVETTTIEKNPTRVNVEIPYNAKEDYKYFKEYQIYECYKVDIPTSGVLDTSGLHTASIRIKIEGSESILTLGLLTFLVEKSNVLPNESITVSQYDYLINLIGQETRQTVVGVGDEALFNNKDVSGRFENDTFLLSKARGYLTIAVVQELKEKVLIDTEQYSALFTAINSKLDTQETNIETLENWASTKDEEITSLSTNKANKSDVYTKEEVDSKIANSEFHYEIVETLPEVGQSNVMYLVLKSKSESGNVYTEYIWVESSKKYEEIGDTAVDLDGYVKGSNLTAEYIVVGNGDGTIKVSTKKVSDIESEIAKKANSETLENLVAETPTDIDYNDGFTLLHDTKEITGQTSKVKLGTNLTYDSATKTINASGGEANETYTNAKQTPYTVGGIKAGSSFDNQTMTEMWNALLYPFVKPSNLRLTIDSGVAIGIVEKGTTISPSATTKLMWAISGNDGTITKIEFFKNNTSVKKVEAASVSTSGYVEWGTDFGTISSDTSIIYKATYKENTSDILTSNALTWTFVDPYFYGVAADGVDITHLTKSVTSKSNKTLSFTTDNNYIYFAYPASYGELTSIKDSNGFENIDGFTKTTTTIIISSGSVEYLVYKSKSASTQSNFMLTFKY